MDRNDYTSIDAEKFYDDLANIPNHDGTWLGIVEYHTRVYDIAVKAEPVEVINPHDTHESGGISLGLGLGLSFTAIAIIVAAIFLIRRRK